jgi:hypothetical protein
MQKYGINLEKTLKKSPHNQKKGAERGLYGAPSSL